VASRKRGKTTDSFFVDLPGLWLLHPLRRTSFGKRRSREPNGVRRRDLDSGTVVTESVTVDDYLAQQGDEDLTMLLPDVRYSICRSRGAAMAAPTDTALVL
jgi:hypothetical protein